MGIIDKARVGKETDIRIGRTPSNSSQKDQATIK